MNGRDPNPWSSKGIAHSEDEAAQFLAYLHKHFPMLYTRLPGNQWRERLHHLLFVSKRENKTKLAFVRWKLEAER